MGTVHRLPHPAVAGPTIGSAVAGFLGGFTNANTARSYAVVLRALATEFGEATPVAVLDTEAGADQLATWFRGRWGSSAAATVNLGSPTGEIAYSTVASSSGR